MKPKKLTDLEIAIKLEKIESEETMKQTAVEWLAEQMLWNEFHNPYLEKAKEIEKEQKIEFANNYGFHICGYDYENAEQYYKETYEKK